MDVMNEWKGDSNSRASPSWQSAECFMLFIFPLVQQHNEKISKLSFGGIVFTYFALSIASPPPFLVGTLSLVISPSFRLVRKLITKPNFVFNVNNHQKMSIPYLIYPIISILVASSTSLICEWSGIQFEVVCVWPIIPLSLKTFLVETQGNRAVQWLNESFTLDFNCLFSFSNSCSSVAVFCLC